MSGEQRAIKADEPGLWAQKLAVLKAGLDTGNAHGVAKVQAEIVKLERKMSLAVERRAIVAQAVMRISTKAITDIDSQDALHRHLTAQVQEYDGMRKDLARLLKGLKRVSKAEDTGQTPELAAKPARVDPIEWLERHEVKHPGEGLTHDQARAAKEIAKVSEAITRAGQAKVGNMEGSGGAGGGYREPEMPAALADIHGARYLPWIDHLHEINPISLHICINVAVRGVSIKSLARHHKMRRSAVLDRLQRGLEQYWNERELQPKYAAKQRKMKDEWDRRNTAS